MLKALALIFTKLIRDVARSENLGGDSKGGAKTWGAYAWPPCLPASDMLLQLTKNYCCYKLINSQNDNSIFIQNGPG